MFPALAQQQQQLWPPTPSASSDAVDRHLGLLGIPPLLLLLKFFFFSLLKSFFLICIKALRIEAVVFAPWGKFVNYTGLFKKPCEYYPCSSITKIKSKWMSVLCILCLWTRKYWIKTLFERPNSGQAFWFWFYRRLMFDRLIIFLVFWISFPSKWRKLLRVIQKVEETVAVSRGCYSGSAAFRFYVQSLID